MNIAGAPYAQLTLPLYNLFVGQVNVDYYSIFDAKINRNDVTVHYDAKRIIGTKNESGGTIVRKIWHPLNKTMHYVFDEGGSDDYSGSAFAAAGRSGLGDVFVLDLFKTDYGQSTDHLQMDVNTTVYWHERPS